MLRCGKTAQSAIAAMSALASAHDGGRTKLSSLDIAESRRLPAPLAAKLLNTLSTGGLVHGTRGPGGGYWLARAPDQICLADIARLFEKESESFMCPLGTDYCGTGRPCPLHDTLSTLGLDWENFMERTTLAIFVGKNRQPKG